jgi:hypothetical protein
MLMIRHKGKRRRRSRWVQLRRRGRREEGQGFAKEQEKGVSKKGRERIFKRVYKR